MPWFRVDDSIPDHPKVDALLEHRDGLAAFGLWSLAGAWASKQLTDGFVPIARVRRLGAKKSHAKRLVSVGLWDEVEGGYQFHDWPDYQPTLAELQEKSSKRAEAGRKGGLKSGRSRREANASPSASPDAPPNGKQKRTPTQPYPAQPYTQGEAEPVWKPPDSWVCVVRLFEQTHPWAAGLLSPAEQRKHAEPIWQKLEQDPERVRAACEAHAASEWVQRERAGLAHLNAQLPKYANPEDSERGQTAEEWLAEAKPLG